MPVFPRSVVAALAIALIGPLPAEGAPDGAGPSCNPPRNPAEVEGLSTAAMDSLVTLAGAAGWTRYADAFPWHTLTVERGAYDPAISPDGATIAFGLLGRIWLVPANGGEAVALTAGNGWDHHPEWSPDGGQLAFVRDAPDGSEIVLYTLPTSDARTLYGRAPDRVVGGGPVRGLVYSFGRVRFHPTNGRLYFVDFRSGIWSVDPRDPPGPPERLLAGSGRLGQPGVTEISSFAFSADGSALVVEKDTTSLWTRLHVTPLEPISFTVVAGPETVRHAGVEWSHDGSSLIYLERHGGQERIVVHDLGTDRVRRVALGAFNGRELALHPEGDRAVVVSGRRLFLLELATGQTTPIPFVARLDVPPDGPRDLVITNARLFDATGAGVVDAVTVVIRDGTIVAVAPGPLPIDAGVRVVDARGRFLMPGLIDAHAHVSRMGMFGLAGVPAMGITSIFDPGSYLPETLNLRDALRLGLMAGPHLYTSGPTIDGPEGRARPLTVANITDAGDARSLVRELAGQGVDAIKLYAFLEPGVVAAVIAEAHAHGLPVIGDQVVTPWDAALDAGIDGLIHLMDHKWRFVSRERPADRWTAVDPDSALMAAFFDRVADRGAMFDPTMMASSGYFNGADFAAALHEGRGEPDGVHRAQVLARMLRSMHRHGVQWVAGTDANPGDLLEELAIYEAVGIPNAVILRAATANVARWLRKDDFGTVEPGKRADLVLVDGNPLERIRDLANVVLVVQAGRVVAER